MKNKNEEFIATNQHWKLTFSLRTFILFRSGLRKTDRTVSHCLLWIFSKTQTYTDARPQSLELVTHLSVYQMTSRWPRLHAPASCCPESDPPCGWPRLRSAAPQILDPGDNRSLSHERLSHSLWPERSPGRWCFWCTPRLRWETCGRLCRL